MSRNELVVWLRIGLWVLTGFTAAGGLPDSVNEYLADPALADKLATAVLFAGNLLWYLMSTARKALKALS